MHSKSARTDRLSLGVAMGILACALILVWQTRGQTLPPAQQAKQQTISLPSGVAIRVSQGWVEQNYQRLPPPPPLAAFAPHLTFSEFLTVQNLQTHSVLMLGLSDNFLLGRDSYSLDSQMHQPVSSGTGMLNHLFYFFFPPPRACLERARAEYDRDVDKDNDSDSGSKSSPKEVNVSLDCRYLPNLGDFYAGQLSRGLSFTRHSGAESIGTGWQPFYLPPTEEVESNGLTFYVFEAQSQHQLTVEQARRFNLPEDLQGSQADYFWAIGAPSPFPFVAGTVRANVPLIHVAYAGLSLGPNSRPEFMRLLRTVTAPPEAN